MKSDFIYEQTAWSDKHVAEISCLMYSHMVKQDVGPLAKSLRKLLLQFPSYTFTRPVSLNILAADVLAPCIPRRPAAMVLTTVTPLI